MIAMREPCCAPSKRVARSDDNGPQARDRSGTAVYDDTHDPPHDLPDFRRLDRLRKTGDRERPRRRAASPRDPGGGRERAAAGVVTAKPTPEWKTDLNVGSGAEATDGKKVTVHYTMWLARPDGDKRSRARTTARSRSRFVLARGR